MMMKNRIEFASADKVNELWPEVEEILRHIASMQKEPEESEEEWLSYAFVSDESRVAEWIYEDSELAELRERLAIPDLALGNLMCDVAAIIRNKKRPY